MEDNRFALQRAEFDAVEELSKRLDGLPAIVDDDYPEARHYYEGAVRTCIEAFKANRPHLFAKPLPPAGSLRAANIARQPEYGPSAGKESLSYWGNAIAGELGEACNVIKKLERERAGQAGSRATVEDLANELADVLIYLDLLAIATGIDLDAAVARKFNKTSEKLGFKTRMVELPA
jgi:NTP pyrophosphatase (non-canonical NTP hydrolase)